MIARRDETGASTIELAMTLPIVLLLACAVLDGVQAITAQVMADQASTAVARTLLADPDAGRSELEAAALSDAPALARADWSLDVERGAVRAVAYDHRFVDSPSQFEAEVRESHVREQDAEVAVRAAFAPLTPVGRAMFGEGGFVASSATEATLDRTEGSTW